ncbi:autotransporter domain-containing protein [Luteimonas aquatica]|uniref:autotransporter domain-containing protein n=1 Tax=Luteimonas aquatica TaxID=450364 RepID=UPI001F5864A4|nr:autotransporter domain-containing protein [Luteimonas aquatica]
MPLLSRPTRCVLAAALALAAAPALAQDHPYSQTVFIGDSLTDSGHFRPALIQAVGPNGALLGRFTTNPGLVWAEWLADFYGTNAVSDNQGGSNYAVGGARTGTEGSGALGPIPSLMTQTNNYLAAHGGRADPNALYTVWGGPNDLFAIARGEAPPSSIATAVGAQIGVIAALKNAGAQYILVPNIPDLGSTPQFRAGGPAQQAAGSQLAATYNAALYNGLASAGLRVIPLDTFNLIREVVANPAPFGIHNVTGTGCNPQITAQSLTCSPLSYAAPDAPDAYAFADGVHPSSKSHRILADYALSVLEGPRQIAVLPRSAESIGRGRADAVAWHLGAKPEGEGARWWTNLRADSQRVGDGDRYDGMVPALLGGVDWTRGDFVFGGFAGYGRGRVDFGLNRGKFTQSDATLGGFAAWYGEQGLWVNGQLSYTKLAFDVQRDVHLGPAMRRHKGSPDGDNVTFAVNAGWNLGEESAPFQHGPVLSLTAQRIDVDGYRENNGELSTALSYRDQSYDSLIGSLGWQASYRADSGFTPYARLTYDHQFEEADEQVFAHVQTLPGTLDYAVPGLEQDRNYGSLTIGAQVPMFGLEANIGGSATLERGDDHAASLFVTLGRSF